MKKKYICPIADAKIFDMQDIITASLATSAYSDNDITGISIDDLMRL
ncbi:MAG: hypothetical protein IJY08_03520 [Clostridia bacterium]|nr:hypothetical protein [Clostridia bacterium]